VKYVDEQDYRRTITFIFVSRLRVCAAHVSFNNFMFISLATAKIFSGAQPASYWLFPLGLNLTGREADNLPQATAELKKDFRHVPLWSIQVQMCLCNMRRAVQILKHRTGTLRFERLCDLDISSTTDKFSTNDILTPWS
jgi:hypothetical protein